MLCGALFCRQLCWRRHYELYHVVLVNSGGPEPGQREVERPARPGQQREQREGRQAAIMQPAVGGELQGETSDVAGPPPERRRRLRQGSAMPRIHQSANVFL